MCARRFADGGLRIDAPAHPRDMRARCSIALCGDCGLQILKSNRLSQRAVSASICTNSLESGANGSGAGVAPWLGVNPKAKALQERTHQFSVRVIALCEALPRTDAARSIALQLLDSSGSTDSNYRGACRARSRKEFIAKLGVAAEEADESLGWLRKLVDRGIGPRDEVSALAQEADELISILVRSQNTAKRNLERNRRHRPQRRRDPRSGSSGGCR